MSIISNYKCIEDEINMLRMQKGLRILWPDYEIYDLLAENMTGPEIQSQAFFPPYILNIASREAISNVPELLKDYTHVAVKSYLHIDQKLQISNAYSIFLTKRNIALDSISSKYLRGKYCLTMQVAQLNRQFSFWGIQVLAECLRTIGPKYIVKRKIMWILEYELDQSPKSLILYSTRRQPSYGKNQNYFDLPRDVYKQACLKFRTYPSVMDNYLKAEGEQKLVNFTGFGHQISAKNLIINKQALGQRNEQQKDSEIDDLMQLKCKIAETHKPQKETAYKSVKIRQVHSSTESFSRYPDFLEEFDFEINRLKQINAKLAEQVKQSLLNNKQSQASSLIPIEAYHLLTYLQKIEYLQHFSDQKTGAYQQIMLNELIIELGSLSLGKKLGQIKVKVWLRLYKLIKALKNESCYQIETEIMQKILIIQSGKLLKDSQDSIEQLQKQLGPNLLQCLIRSLEYYQFNQLFTSDLLFILMKCQKLQSVFQLYRRYQIIHSSLYVSTSFQQYLSLKGVPCNYQLDLIYDIKCEITKLEYLQIENNDNSSQKLAQSMLNFKRYSIFIQRFQETSLLVSKIFTVSEKTFKLFIYKENEHIFCFIQFLGAKERVQSRNIVFHTFNIMIQLACNQKSRRKFFGWNFSLPSHSVGCRFQMNHQQISTLECSVYMKSEIVHQSIMNYITIRYVQLFKFSNQFAQTEQKQNYENQRLSKRRSTFQLQNLFFETSFDILQPDCFFHRKCEKCEHLLEIDSIYSIHQVDMFSILLSTSFKKEIHSLMCFFKYVLLKSQKQVNINFLMGFLRAAYVSLSDLLGLCNRHSLDRQPGNCLKVLVQYKLKFSGNNTMKEKSEEKYIFSEKGRSLLQMRTFIQKDYSKQLLEYIKSQH